MPASRVGRGHFFLVLPRLVQGILRGVNQVLQAEQVAILMVSLGPGHVVAQVNIFWSGACLAKVNHPNTGMALPVMEEKQGAANHLVEKR